MYFIRLLLSSGRFGRKTVQSGRDRCGHDRMVVEVITTYAISAYDP